MCDSPASLLETCLDCICDSYETVFAGSSTDDEDSRNYELPETTCQRRIAFKDPDMYLFTELSERLLIKFMEKGLLNDCTINLFSGRNTRLRNVKIKDAPISYEGLKVLKEHKLRELQCVRMGKISIGKILDCLNEYSTTNLTHLNVSHCTFIDMSRHSLMVQLTNLKYLRSLNISYTEFNQQTLQMICEDLHHLEKLDISGTYVKCLEPLLLLKDRLISLIASDLHGINKMTEEIIEMHQLRHLDLSLMQKKFDNIRNQAICDVLENPDKLPNLVYLDISGWPDLITKTIMENYFVQHPKLKYVGLVLNPIAYEIFLSEPAADFDVVIAGLGNEQQIKTTLLKYYDRHAYVQKALYHLFQLTGALECGRSDLFELVLPAMAAHPMKFGVQMAATACLYNLTRGEISKNIHPKLLSQAVHLTLNAMECYSEEYQLQKNGLLTLCSDRILQEVSFDRFRCARLVLDSLCAFDEINMNRMSVAICSILAAKISTAETSELGAKPLYMQKLLNMVKTRVELKQSDITLRFTLSALWNLTDESSDTCRVFVENKGAELFLDVLRVFQADAAVETKVLGLLNNIAEVESLRSHLMIDLLIKELFSLLKYQAIDVSYFAAGIVAHLASDGDENWKVSTNSREEMLAELEDAVTGWGVPDNEMVAYRSFKPFFPLLRIGMDYRVQLWAVWAIHHVCTKNPKRYCVKLREENGVDLLRNLLEDVACHKIITYICKEILETVYITFTY